jgi:hypothetical protein
MISFPDIVIEKPNTTEAQQVENALKIGSKRQQHYPLPA